MRGGETRAQLAHVAELDLQSYRGAAADLLVQGFATDILHGDERMSLVVTEVVDDNDVAVGKAGDGSGLAFEAPANLVVVQTIEQRLDRYISVELGVVGQIQLAHAALTKHLEDPVPVDMRGHRHGTGPLSPHPSVGSADGAPIRVRDRLGRYAAPRHEALGWASNNSGGLGVAPHSRDAGPARKRLRTG